MKKRARPAGPPDSAKFNRPEYRVEHVVGGIERVILSMRDDAKNLCLQVTLASPGMIEVQAPNVALELPPNWSLERAIRLRDATACGARMRRWPEGAVAAAEISGSVRWGNSPMEKTAVDLKLSFPAQGGEPAVTDRLSFKR